MSEGDRGNLVYTETLPWRLLGSNISPRKMSQCIWVGRVGGFVVVISSAVVILGITDWGTWEYLAVLLSLIGIFMVFFQTEALWREQRRAANPMKVYENGVDIWIFPYERLLGRSNWIPKENIEEVEILRYQTWQNPKEGGCLRWKNAPVELVIHTKNGKKRLTGTKLPVGIMKVATLMNEMWGVRIKDTGEGMGTAVPFVLERAKMGWRHWH